MKIKEVFDVVVAASKMISSMHCISNTEYPLVFALPKKTVSVVTKTVQNKKNDRNLMTISISLKYATNNLNCEYF